MVVCLVMSDCCSLCQDLGLVRPHILVGGGEEGGGGGQRCLTTGAWSDYFVLPTFKWTDHYHNYLMEEKVAYKRSSRKLRRAVLNSRSFLLCQNLQCAVLSAIAEERYFSF